MKKFITVVFEVNDNDAFAPEFGRMHKAMTEDTGQPWRVTGISLDDEMYRVELIEQALDMDDGVYICNEIISRANVWTKNIQDFIS